LLNAAKSVKKHIEEMKVVVCGAGAAGTAISKLLLCIDIEKNICTSFKDVIVCDSKGILYEGREDMNEYKKDLAKKTNRYNSRGSLENALDQADVFVGVSSGNVLNPEWIQKMNENPIIFALANPVPEIMPEKAIATGAAIVATGRGDYPNQVNNALAFPGIFRGALDTRAKRITNEMKIAASHALAEMIEKPTRDRILPHILEPEIAQNIAKAVKEKVVE